MVAKSSREESIAERQKHQTEGCCREDWRGKLRRDLLALLVSVINTPSHPSHAVVTVPFIIITFSGLLPISLAVRSRLFYKEASGRRRSIKTPPQPAERKATPMYSKCCFLLLFLVSLICSHVGLCSQIFLVPK
jgi:hypothetical protein